MSPARASASGSIARPRPLRKDAAHNRELLLAAAAKVFAEHGLGASVDEVAREAGVGMGTLYRRFPTKKDLVDALVHDVLTSFIDIATAAAQAPNGTGLEAFLHQAAALQTDRRGCLPRLWNSPAENALVLKARAGIGVLLEQAKQHGQVREEITDSDVTVALWAVRGVIESSPDGVNAWPRLLEVLLAGMRPGPKPFAHQSLTRPELEPARKGSRRR